MGWMRDETGLGKRAANYVPLTPLSHLQRAALVFAKREAVVYGETRMTYEKYYRRVTRLASALAKMGVQPGDVVSTILPNIPAQAEAAFGVPACGAVLNTINTRLDVDTVAYIFDHGEAKVVLVDSQFMPLAMAAVDLMDGTPPVIIEVPDDQAGVPAMSDHQNYEDFLLLGDPEFAWILPQDEWESLALNYTSGTTGRPKGVVYHHRGAYLMTMGTPISWELPLFMRYLTIVPLFHCNGWNHTWMLPALGGTIVCCRDVSTKAIYDAIGQEGVTHFGFNVKQVYGLTETYGHVTECIWDNEWDTLPSDEQAAIKARQGVAFPMMEDVTVVDNHMGQVPRDGATQGEIVMRGNAVMKGYLKNADATEKAFAGGYFHSEDLAIQHPDGSIQISDRAKDIIISGGENISSVEVEGALMHHVAVNLCAVVAKPDDKWGEVPCAFVELKEGAHATEAEIIAFARERLAGFKCPKRVVFQDLPKTSTGKIQKFELRTFAKTL